MAYDSKVIDQDVLTSTKKLPTRKEKGNDDPSKVGFWSADLATASGHDELPENFNNPHGGKSRGTKYPC